MAKRILVVEDDELNRRLLHDLLWSRGYETIETGNGQAAWELAQEQKPDLMLVDMQLPVMSGLELTRRVKADAELGAIPVVALTAFALRADEARIRQSGCDEYLTKPFHLQGLLDVVARYVGDEREPPDGGDPTPPDDGADRSDERRVSEESADPVWTVDEGFSATRQDSDAASLDSAEVASLPAAPSTTRENGAQAARSPLAGATLLFAVVFAANALWPTAIWQVEDTDLYLVDFPQGAQGLTAGSDVRQGGVSVGKVMRVDVDEGRVGAARAVLKLDSSAAVRGNPVVRVRQENIIGTAYLDLRDRIRASDILARHIESSTSTARSVEAHMREVVTDFPQFLERAALMVETVAKTVDTPDFRALSRSLDQLGLLIAMLSRDFNRFDEARGEMLQLLAEARTLARLLMTIADAARADAPPNCATVSTEQALAH